MSRKSRTSCSPKTTSAGASIFSRLLGDAGREQPLVDAVAGRELQLERAALHLGDERAHVGRRCAGRPLGAVDPEPHVHLDRRVDVAALERVLLGLPALEQLVRELVVVERRVEQRQRADALGVRERDVERDRAAHRGRDERGAVEAVAVHRVEHVAAVA